MRYVTIKLHGEQLDANAKQQLMADIQAALVSATGNDDIPTCIGIEEIAEGNWGLLGLTTRQDEKEGQATGKAPPAEPPLKPIGVFKYRSDFDDQGIIAHLAGRPHHPYSNPATARIINVRSSSLMHDSAPVSAVVGPTAVRCVTQALPNSWFEIDLQDYRVAPTHYSLRHYSSWDVEALRHWTLEASPDGLSWHLLSNHINDTALNAKGSTHTWPVTAPPDTYYRYFRITQRGLNSNNHHYLALSGFDLYGRLSLQTTPTTTALENPTGRKLVMNPDTMARIRGSLNLKR